MYKKCGFILGTKELMFNFIKTFFASFKKEEIAG
jgi:hypothetical protein